MIIFVTEQKETHKSAVDLLKKNKHTVVYNLDKTPAEKIEALFIRTYTKATKEYLEQFPNVKYILRIGVGVDNIDMEECKKRNITVINAPGSNANAVAEYVVGMMIASLRSFFVQSKFLHEKKWRDKNFIGSEIKNKTIGIVGCGAIGKLIAKKLQNFEVKNIIGYDPFLTKEQMKATFIDKVELDELIESSDIITLHLPLIKETKNLIDAKKFVLMKPNAILINSSRGGIVNETDLIHALKNKTVKGAVLDVFENEPEIREELLHLDNLIATPHIAGYTEEADEEMSLMPVRKFLEMLQ